MKRLIFTSLLALAAGTFSQAQAQGSRQYQDDIYGGSSPATQQSADDGQQPAEESNARDDAPVYSSRDNGVQNSSGSNWGNTREYQDESSSLDDDYYYSTRIQRFYYPFSARPYWSSFYNPYWYDPFWVDPYMGWSPWTPGVSISVGYGPYWSSYWGYSSWYGCPAFGSYYSYPYYGFGGYYSGYWNGYYAGLYNGYGDAYGARQTVSYGPRYNLRPRQTSLGLSNGVNTFRVAPPSRPAMNGSQNPRNAAPYRPEPGAATAADRRAEMIRDNAPAAEPRREERPMRNGWAETPAVRNEEARPSAAPAQPDRGSRNQQYQQQRADVPQRPAAPVPDRNYARPAEPQRSEPAFPSRSYERNSGGFDRGGSNFGGGNNSGGSRGGFGGGGGRRR